MFWLSFDGLTRGARRLGAHGHGAFRRLRVPRAGALGLCGAPWSQASRVERGRSDRLLRPACAGSDRRLGPRRSLPQHAWCLTMADRDPTLPDYPLLAQLEVQTAVTRMLHAIDALDSQAFRAVFEPELRLDFTSLFPGRPETITIDALLSRWVPFATDSMQRISSAQSSSLGRTVVARRRKATAHASHYLPRPGWAAVDRGRALRVDAGAAREHWKIAGIIFRLLFQDGNPRLPELAPERGAAGRGRPLPSAPRS